MKILYARKQLAVMEVRGSKDARTFGLVNVEGETGFRVVILDQAWNGSLADLRQYRTLDQARQAMLSLTPVCTHRWQEQPGEPPVDVCSLCGRSRS